MFSGSRLENLLALGRSFNILNSMLVQLALKTLLMKVNFVGVNVDISCFVLSSCVLIFTISINLFFFFLII